MAFICPRDQTKLSWIRFVMNGKWACQACAGAFVFEKDLKAHLSGKKFLRHLRSLNSEHSRLKCPSCHDSLKAITFGMPLPTEVDRCLKCELVWFDAEEIKQLIEAAEDPGLHLPDPRLRYSGDEPTFTNEHFREFAKVLLDAHDHSGDLRWKRYSKPILAALISSIHPRRLWVGSLMSYFYLFQALMTWYARM